MLASAFALVCLPLMSTSAEAANAGYYHPDDVAGASALFNQSAEWAGDAFGHAQNDVSRLGSALSQLELGVGLLGDDRPRPRHRAPRLPFRPPCWPMPRRCGAR